MTSKFKSTVHTALLAGLLTSTVAVPAVAGSEGYFQSAFGARHSGLSGAGLAHITDSTGLGLNPAGIVGIGRQYNVGLTLFSPRRETIGAGQPGLTPLGTVKSGQNYFVIPNFSYVAPAGDRGAWGVGVFANGGMNTSYPAVDRALAECGGGSGVLCGGEAGVDLMQAFVTAGYGYQLTDNLKVGVEAKLAIQRFQAEGLAALSGFSSDPDNFTNNGHDWSTGVGFKLGATYSVGDLSLAATYQSKFNMSKFEKYAGLFAEQGDFDIPESYSLGAAYRVSDAVTVMADYRYIDYAGVAAVGNSGGRLSPFGADFGPGFGWQEVSSYKVGVEVQATENLMLRLGAALNDNPIPSSEVTLNVLAPGVVTDHYSAGFSYDTGAGGAVNFSATYVPYNSVTGSGMMNPNHTVTIGMKQYSATIGWGKKF